jgi:hypothetical protein
MARSHRVTFALSFLAGGGVGLLGWNGHEALLPAALLFPALFGLAPSRASAMLLSFGYFLAASRGLPAGAMTFFRAEIHIGLALWLSASLAFVAVHTALWSSAPGGRALGISAATILMALPPLGIAGWASPLTAAGVLFPGLGWLGLAFTSALVGVLAHKRTVTLSLAFVALLWVTGQALNMPPRAPDGWSGVATEIVYNTGSRDFEKSYAFFRAASAAVDASDAPIMVFPEGAAGWRTETAEEAWMGLARRSGKILYAGAEEAHGPGYDNVLVRITGTSFETVYRQRMPVPVSMWRPWAARSAHAHLGEAGAVALDGRLTGVLICYEQLLVWPILQSRLAGADHLLGIGNAWWARETSIAQIQAAVLSAWARLFNMDLTVSFNT